MPPRLSKPDAAGQAPSVSRALCGCVRIRSTIRKNDPRMWICRKNSCVLPEDLKNFYLMSDGFHMTWSVKFDDNPMPLGSMVINGISKLSRLGGSSAYALPNAPTLADLEDDMDEEDDLLRSLPTLIFYDSSHPSTSKQCYPFCTCSFVSIPVVTPDTEIWFLDRALYWHFLTDSFTAYYRLLITHLGLPQWQYAFTSYGVSPQAKSPNISQGYSWGGAGYTLLLARGWAERHNLILAWSSHCCSLLGSCIYSFLPFL
uniref:Knr4/Smi1-like domain-containing protein n=1 Tax=Terrapene triunguis TaxID=2587831 RepID=A0A674J6Z7_9SAUR